MAWTKISSMCALWPWPRRYDNGSRSWHTLGSWTTIVWTIIQIKLGSEELWPGHGFPVYVHCDLDLGDMSICQGHDTPLGHGQQLCEILSRSNLAVRSYGPDTDFQYMCTVTLTLEIWASVKVMTHPWVMDTIVWNIIQIQLGSEELWPRHGFPVCVHCDLDLRDMTLGQGHDTLLGHGQQLCEILFRSNLAVRSYDPDTNFQYVCTVTLTLEIWPWVKVMTHSWIMDNNCVKYYPDPTWQWGVMARTRISSICALWPWPWRNCVKLYPESDKGVRSYGPDMMWTDGQTDRVIPIYPPKFVCGGYNYKHYKWVSEIGCLTSHATIFQLYMWQYIDVQADWRRRSWTYGRAPNAIDI